MIDFLKSKFAGLVDMEIPLNHLNRFLIQIVKWELEIFYNILLQTLLALSAHVLLNPFTFFKHTGSRNTFAPNNQHLGPFGRGLPKAAETCFVCPDEDLEVLSGVLRGKP